MRQRFELDEAKAREWLTAAAARSPFGCPRFALDPTWCPACDDDGTGAEELVTLAQEVGAILQPGPAEYLAQIAFLFTGSDDDEVVTCYQWVLTVRHPSFLPVTGSAGDMSGLGHDAEGRHQTGVEAGLAVLREAVEQANTMLGWVDRYVESVAARVPF